MQKKKEATPSVEKLSFETNPEIFEKNLFLLMDQLIAQPNNEQAKENFRRRADELKLLLPAEESEENSYKAIQTALASESEQASPFTCRVKSGNNSKFELAKCESDTFEKLLGIEPSFTSQFAEVMKTTIKMPSDAEVEPDKVKSAVYINETLLLHKSRQLCSKKESRAAGAILYGTWDSIKIKNDSDSLTPEFLHDVLIKAKNDPIIRKHRGAKQVIMNFLAVVLSAGAALIFMVGKKIHGMAKEKSLSGGSFFFRPETKTEKMLDKFAKDLPQEENQSNKDMKKS